MLLHFLESFKTIPAWGSYALSFFVAAISDSIIAAFIAGAFGLAGVVLQIYFNRQQSKIHEKADRAKELSDLSAQLAMANRALLEVREDEVKDLKDLLRNREIERRRRPRK
jgi:hypothetical protein